jgi:hypothetical protein
MAVLLALTALNGSLLAQDIIFTNRTATFTNLEGRVFTNVTLVKANDYGVVWRGDGAGMVPYTKLSPQVLESLGIPQERVERSKALLARQAALAAKMDQASLAAKAKQKAEADAARAKWEAEAPARQREAERQAALAQIRTLTAQIAAARQELRRAEAIASDQNMVAPIGTYYFVPNDAKRQLNIENAEEQLSQLRQDYIDKYGALPK